LFTIVFFGLSFFVGGATEPSWPFSKVVSLAVCRQPHLLASRLEFVLPQIPNQNFVTHLPRASQLLPHRVHAASIRLVDLKVIDDVFQVVTT